MWQVIRESYYVHTLCDFLHFFLKLCKKILDMTTHSYTMYTDLKEGLLHPAVTTVLWIVCMKIIQKRHAVLHE